MQWFSKKWNELTPEQIYKILDLRISTFVVEQKRIYHELDDNDLTAIHVFGEEDGKVLAYARIFKMEDKVTFGRVVTSKKARGRGIGMELLQEIMATIKENYPNKKIEIASQFQVRGFYEKAGFKTEGEKFILESTPHIKMVHEAL